MTWISDNLPTFDEKTARSWNMVLQQDTDYSLDGKNKKKRESFKNDDNKKNTYTPSQEKTIEITWSHNKNLENLNLRERIPSTGHRGGHRVIYVTSLCRWTAERRTTAWVEKLITEIGFGELWSPMCLKNAAHRIRYVVNAWNEFIYSSRFISL